jgi:hypothetical protein
LTLYLESIDELGKSIPEERGLKQPTYLGVTVPSPNMFARLWGAKLDAKRATMADAEMTLDHQLESSPTMIMRTVVQLHNRQRCGSKEPFYTTSHIVYCDLCPSIALRIACTQ